ncbi:MAG: PAS domain S-box protein [Ignavibacteriales bacterium]|nr:PAS domain S-box protein [Ignavibacteriales bacterium]
MKTPNILVVEDESIVSLEIQGRLEELGYTVAGAVYSGEDAIASAKELLPDLILMDINLRGNIDGIEAANFIKKALNIPIIYMTAYADEETIQRAKVTAPYAYIIKPIEVRELHTSIEIAMFKSQMEKKLIESEHRFRSLFENATLGLYRTSLEGEVLMANNALIKMLGYDSFEDLVNKDVVSGYVNPEIRNDFIKLLESEGSVLGFESQWKKKDGSIIYISESARRGVDEEGNIVFDGTIEDITNKKLAQDELKDSKEMLQTVFDNVYDAILIHDINGKIIVANKKALSLFNINPDEVLETNVLDFSAEETSLEKAQEGWNSVLEGKPLLVENKAKRLSEQSSFDIEIFISKVSINKNNYLLANIRDITERKKVKEAIIQAKEKAEESDRLKSEFLASMSHEIRTPVNTILNYTSLLKADLVDLVQNQFGDIFHSINIGGQRLIRTVDSILNMSQIQTGTFEVVKQKMNLENDILDSVFAEFKVEAANKGIEFKIEKNTTSAMVYGDNYSLGQLFTNLVDNAIKYTKEGKVKIKTYNNGNGELYVDVSDTGIGISEKFLENIFTPFSQETQGYTRRFDGNGLGLALVKKYCELNDANISIKSTKGTGSTFTVKFNQPS